MKPLRIANETRPLSRLGWTIHNAATEADIDLYDVIGDDGWGDGISAASFVRDLRDIKASRINLHINSPGGLVDDGLAMYNALRDHSAEVHASIEGVAASAASFIAMAADHIAIKSNAKMVIHDAQALTWIVDVTNAAGMDQLIGQLQQMRNILDEESNNIASIYSNRAGGSTSEWRRKMQANGTFGTTYRGQEAVDAGLADEVSAGPAKKMPMPGMNDRARNAAIPYADHGKAPEGETWSAPTLSDFTDQQWADLSDAEKRRIAAHFAWEDANPPTTFGDLKLGHHRPQTTGIGPAVKAGVDAAMARLDQAQIDDVDAVRAHLESHQEDFGENEPEPGKPDDELDEITLAMIPPLALGYRPPSPDVEVLLAKGVMK